MKTGWVVGKLVDVIKVWVNLFNVCWRWVNVFWRWVNFLFSPTSFFKFVIFIPSFCFTHLQISPTCRFHPLADFVCLHLSCFIISVVCVRLHVIFTLYFVSPTVPQKSIFTHMLCALVSLTGRCHLMVRPSLLQFVSIVSLLMNHGNPIFELVCHGVFLPFPLLSLIFW